MGQGTALVLGDSQAQLTGQVLADGLRKAGYSVVLRAMPGQSTQKMLATAQDLGQTTFDIVCVFGGGNDTPGTHAAVQILACFPGAAKFWFGPPPATTILSLANARAKFGSKINDTQYWFASGAAGRREQNNAEIKASLQGLPGVQFADFRLADLAGPVQASGVAFPNQTDGIHVSKATGALALNHWWPALVGSSSNATVAALGKVRFAAGLPWGWVAGGVGAAVAALWWAERARKNPEAPTDVNFPAGVSGRFLGYKVMRWDPSSPKVAVSGADSRVRQPLQRGIVHSGDRVGIFVGNSAQYVLDHYAVHPFNVLITYSFRAQDILYGDPSCREPEVGLAHARVEAFAIYDEEGQEVAR